MTFPMFVGAMIVFVGVGYVIGKVIESEKWELECKRRRLIKHRAKDGKLVWIKDGERIP